MDGAAIEWITDALLQTLACDEPLTAPALTFLLRRYGATARDDLRAALEPALARAVEGPPSEAPCDERAEWLTLFVEAVAVSADERLRPAAAALLSTLEREWGRTTYVDQAAASIDACLGASDVFDPHDLVQNAIDELERVVGAAYRPGEGVAHVVNEPSSARGRLGDHVRCASALLTAYSRTGRLPYSMLAEELMQFVRRTLWDEQDGGFYDIPHGTKPFALNCEAARVLCRLAGLHHEDEYRKAAVVASDADYLRDAARTLGSQTPAYRQYGPLSAVYGLALDEWLGLQSALSRS